LAAIAKRRRELDVEEYHEVLRARAAGVSWQGIAAVLGVSRQAVHKKFKRRIQG
jgi:DNA invertase Pin-like site-specific DNA recombinase